MGWKNLSITKRQLCNRWSLKMDSYFIQQIIMGVITYPCLIKVNTMLVEGVQGSSLGWVHQVRATVRHILFSRWVSSKCWCQSIRYNAICYHYTCSSFSERLVCRLFGTKPSLEQMIPSRPFHPQRNGITSLSHNPWLFVQICFLSAK